MFSYENNLLRSRQPQPSHLLHLDVPYHQPFPPSPSPNSASPPPPKVTEPKCDNSQLSLTVIANRLPLQQLRSNLRRLHINPRRILDIQYSDRNLVSFLIHIVYEAEVSSQLNKFNITARDDLNPLDPSIIRNPALVNETIDCKIQPARKSFLHRIYTALQRFRAPNYNAVANFFVQSGFIDPEDLASYGLAPLYRYRT
ncbi:hypothetical protein G6F62_012816 [Rhizopus arrhizus]|nr:hypothetical protein G6F62_012816 [Rhizopus arrhizus]